MCDDDSGGGADDPGGRDGRSVLREDGHGLPGRRGRGIRAHLLGPDAAWNPRHPSARSPACGRLLWLAAAADQAVVARLGRSSRATSLARNAGRRSRHGDAVRRNRHGDRQHQGARRRRARRAGPALCHRAAHGCSFLCGHVRPGSGEGEEQRASQPVDSGGDHLAAAGRRRPRVPAAAGAAPSGRDSPARSPRRQSP